MNINFKNNEVLEFAIFAVAIALFYFIGLFYTALMIVGLGVYMLVTTFLSKDPSLGIGGVLGFIVIIFGIILLSFSDFPTDAISQPSNIDHGIDINPPSP